MTYLDLISRPFAAEECFYKTKIGSHQGKSHVELLSVLLGPTIGWIPTLVVECRHLLAFLFDDRWAHLVFNVLHGSRGRHQGRAFDHRLPIHDFDDRKLLLLNLIARVWHAEVWFILLLGFGFRLGCLAIIDSIVDFLLFFLFCLCLAFAHFTSSAFTFVAFERLSRLSVRDYVGQGAVLRLLLHDFPLLFGQTLSRNQRHGGVCSLSLTFTILWRDDGIVFEKTLDQVKAFLRGLLSVFLGFHFSAKTIC